MKYFFLFLFLIILISCKKPAKEQKDIQVTTSEFSVPKEHTIMIQVAASNEKEISNWVYYSNLKEFISKFNKTTPNEALSNALELSSLVKILKDSTSPTPLNTPSVEARINLLETESLRLSDMTKISAIKANEINNQINKLFEAFSSLNSKINTVFLQKSLDKGVIVEDFNLDTKNEKLPINNKPNKKTPKLKRLNIKKDLKLKDKTPFKKLPSKNTKKAKAKTTDKKGQKKKPDS